VIMSSNVLGVSTSNIYAVASNPPVPGSVAPPTASALMPEPEPTGDIAFVMAKMMVENAYRNREQARQDRQHGTEAMVAAQSEQIAHMRAAAEERYAAAKLEAWGKIGDGVFGVTGGCVTAGGSAPANAGIGSAIGSGGHVFAGGFSLAASSNKHAGDELEADAKAAENHATQLKRQVEGADDDIKEARDHMRAAIDFLREFESTKTKSLSSAIKA